MIISAACRMLDYADSREINVENRVVCSATKMIESILKVVRKHKFFSGY